VHAARLYFLFNLKDFDANGFLARHAVEISLAYSCGLQKIPQLGLGVEDEAFSLALKDDLAVCSIAIFTVTTRRPPPEGYG